MIQVAADQPPARRHLQRRAACPGQFAVLPPDGRGCGDQVHRAGKLPDAEAGDYARVISADASLSAKLLAWRTPPGSVCAPSDDGQGRRDPAGAETVRTLAISYCMTGLHSDLDLSPDEAKIFWEACLCKAVAAKQYVSLFDAALGDQAFIGGLPGLLAALSTQCESLVVAVCRTRQTTRHCSSDGSETLLAMTCRGSRARPARRRKD